MNHWDAIWKKRDSQIEISNDVFDMFCKLKSANGFDTQQKEGYYEAFFAQWQGMEKRIKKFCAKEVESVYEVGCGSGVNLYLFQKLSEIGQVGGIDYSTSLIEIAHKVLESNDIRCGEASEIITDKKYDVVLADSVFQYFYDVDYGRTVLQKMYEKAEQMVIVTEIHDIEKREQHLQYRRSLVSNYDEVYKGLDKTFYPKELFIEFAKEKRCRYIIVEPDNKAYWNNDFVFDFYLYK